MAAAAVSLRTLRFKFNNPPPFSSKKSFPNGFLRLRSKGCCGRYSMFLKAAPAVKDGVLSFNGKKTVLDVPENVVVTPSSDSSLFLGAFSDESKSRHVFKLGVIEEARLLSLFRFKIWWMVPRVGSSGKDIPVETQMLLLEAREEVGVKEPDGNKTYVLFLPILDGECRSSLQGNIANELEVCVEAGDSSKVGPGSSKAVFVNYGDNPFKLIKESMKILQKCSGTFDLRDTKQAFFVEKLSRSLE